MTKAFWLLTLGVCATLVAASTAAKEPADDAAEPGWLLRYKFQQGETIRWEVEHRAQIRTTVSGTTQTVETLSTSVKAWQVTDVNEQGEATFVHQVESVDMRHRLTGRQEVRYNSDTDKEPPEGFADVAKAVGVPLTIITLDDCGKILKRVDKRDSTNATPGAITIPLPVERVPLGHEWFLPADIQVNLPGGEVKKIKSRQRFRLDTVRDGVASIEVETQILSPVRDPYIEAQLIQGKTNGTIQFDLEAGRVIAQQTDVDDRVSGFQGEASSLHCVTRFSETLLPPEAKTARRVPVAGPEPAPK